MDLLWELAKEAGKEAAARVRKKGRPGLAVIVLRPATAPLCRRLVAEGLAHKRPGKPGVEVAVGRFPSLDENLAYAKAAAEVLRRCEELKAVYAMTGRERR